MAAQIPARLAAHGPDSGIDGRRFVGPRGHGNFWERLYEIIIHLPETQLATLITGVLCLILLVALEHSFHKIPAALVALVFGIIISVVFGLEARGVEIVGAIPAGWRGRSGRRSACKTGGSCSRVRWGWRW